MKTMDKMHWKEIAVILIIFLFFSLILEQVVRFHLFVVDSFNYQKMKTMGSIGKTGSLQKSNIPEVNYELKPNLDTYYKMASLKTNTRGLRDKEYSLEKPMNTFRVAVIGGSFTFASGVEIDDAYHSLLEEELNEKSEGLNYEFINFGVPGYVVNNKIGSLKYKVFDYNPDLILFVLDRSRFTGYKNIPKFVPKPTENYFFKSYTLQLLMTNELLDFRYRKKKSNTDKLNVKNLNKLDAILQEIKNISENSHVPICIVVLDYEYWRYDLLSEGISTLVEKNDLCYSNTLPYFKDTNAEDMAIFKIDYHPNEKAHKIFAESILEGLKEQFLPKDR